MGRLGILVHTVRPDSALAMVRVPLVDLRRVLRTQTVPEGIPEVESTASRRSAKWLLKRAVVFDFSHLFSTTWALAVQNP